MTGTYAVVLERSDGTARTLEVEADETVLRASERTGSAVPFGCRTGACGTCVGRVLEVGGNVETDGGANEVGDGKTAADGTNEDGADDDEPATDPTDVFEYRRPPRALKPRHREDGYVLLCIATPRADCRVAVGSTVRSGLVDNPWK